jgi:hypothetical protein
MTKEVLTLALDALEGLFGTAEQFEGGGVAVWRLGGSHQPKQAIAAIKEALAQPEQKPMHPELRKMYEDYFDKCFRESSPPQRTWVDLTDEEIDKAWRSVDYTVPWEQHRIDIAQAIEQALKEKNV